MDESIVGVVLMALLLLPPMWQITRRTGLPPYISLVVLVPFLGFLIWALVLAFAPWPSKR
ncbi:MAG: hypothetical protein KJ011_08670 [Burkholderiaceae bacterium]|nr:hypothetical protein [Burkholderiaceae bacterium]